MSNTVISVENLSKTYHLGQIGTGTFSRDLALWWAKARGKPSPFLKIGETERLPSPDGSEAEGEGDTLWALRDVSFTVEQGEVLGIIGRNGAGKSTLLKILSRVTAPTSGKIKVKGRVASLLEVGTGFHPELTGRENIYLNGAILGMSKQEIARKFDEIVDFAEVEKFIDTPVKRYSSGMYVRLAFAVAAHLEPEILVVDEVLAVGDAEFQKKCLGKMDAVAQEGRTILFVSHNMDSIKRLCKKGILLSKGEIKVSSDIDTVVQQYAQGNEQATENKNPIQISDQYRNHGTKDVKINLVSIKDLQGSYKTEFYIGEPFFIEFDIVNEHEYSKHISCWYSISSMQDVRLGTSLQYDDQEYEIKAHEKIKIQAEFQDNIFFPGKYRLTVGILGRQKSIFEWCENIAIINILPTFWGTERGFDGRMGTLSLRSKWKILP